MPESYDFSGWATRNNIRCSDGRIILRDAFRDCDGATVPLVWNHQHNAVDNVLGHALLENRDEGVYAYCKFNDTDSGKAAKLVVEHGDINSLSIYANKLKQQGPNVLHGMIREVSLVHAGANPGAYIETIIQHGEELEDEAYIYSGEEFELFHSDNSKQEKKEEEPDDSEETVGDVFNTLTDKQKAVVYAMIGEALQDGSSSDSDDSEEEPEEKEEPSCEEKPVKHSENEGDEKPMAENTTVQDVLDSMTEEQKAVMYALIGQALQEGGGADEDNMKHNVFDDDYDDGMFDDVLSHSEIEDIITEARDHRGSLKDTFLAHGIDNIDFLFPDDRNLTNEPQFIKREDSWVDKVMSGVSHTPFSRVRSLFADITADEARAKGYIKGNLKKEEVFNLLKRSTEPTTVYKKQAIHRDDKIDITNLNVINWLQKEMRMMLNEELARAYLIGDGRLSSSEDKINEQNIRPIWKDADLFTVKYPVSIAANASDDQKAKAFIKACVKSRKLYKGSGNPTLFTTEDMLTSMLLLEDNMGRLIYDSVDKIATVLRVKEIVTVQPMEGKSRYDSNNNELTLAGIYVNLKDYNVGADEGGEINTFDQFDIDFNMQKYLMETRCSGAMTVPFGAVALEFYVGNGLTLTVEGADEADEWLGMSVANLQSGVNVSDDYITGTLHYVDDFVGFSGKESEQRGNFLALHFDTETGSTTTVEIVGGKSGPVTLDSDNVWIGRISNPDTQTIRVITTKNGSRVTKIYGLNRLVCERE